ncbi:PIR Superfamily Protein [Plasmodium ovale curtisi]|uniref:PIR Superfamily Protein n=1 Tax=Plasmodium ovale curtisi TaxID=864141 RepID=A0A1A8XDM8_PLAOA|nr:PIR Superfamily Protein [Plasmodium ovale curtisi]
MEEGERILKTSSKYELYNKFSEKPDDVSKYSGYCRSMEYLKTWYSDILEVCYVFSKNLINLHEILKEEEDDGERCRYFNFWITDHVKKKLETQWKDKRYIASILRGLYGVEHAIKKESPNNNCYLDHRSKITLDLWKERKDLHDYIRNYNYIIDKINSNGYYCTLYSKYFVYIKGLHDKYKSECCNGSSDKCPHLLDLYYFCNNDKFINKLLCDENKGVVTASSREEIDQVLEEPDESGRYNSESASLHDQNKEITGDIITNNSDYYTKLGIGLPFLGIVSTIFYLYKFTTFGNIIRSKVLKTKIKVNLDEDAQNLMTHELNNEYKSFYSDDYKIAYNP